MPSHDIICPTCLAPASKWFEFGGRADPHGYYHCDACACSCAVQHRGDGQPGRRSLWVREGMRAPTSRRIPPQAVAHRAYQLHEQRGGDHGHDLDDWLRAERDLAGSFHVWATDGASATDASEM